MTSSKFCCQSENEARAPLCGLLYFSSIHGVMRIRLLWDRHLRARARAIYWYCGALFERKVWWTEK